MGAPHLGIAAKRVDVSQIQAFGQGIRRAIDGCIEIGVGDQKGSPASNELEGPGLGRPAGEDTIGRAKQQRMVCDEEIHLAMGQSPDDVLGHFVAHADDLDVGLGVAQLETDRIPSFRTLRSGPFGKGSCDVANLWHDPIVNALVSSGPEWT